MALEQTLFLIKPNGMKHEEKILDKLSSIGERCVYTRYDTAPIDLVTRHYTPYQNESETVFRWMIEGYKGKPMASGIIQGQDAIEKMLKITGDTDPEHAEQGTIRHMAFLINKESLARSIQEKRMCDNFIHRSKRDAFKFERGIWHPDASLYS